MFEHRSDPLATPAEFQRRMLQYGMITITMILFSLLIGILGYHVFESLSWVDSLLNASMILGGMGPVDPVRTAGGKAFASFYALFSGVVFLVVVGLMMAPAAHRLLHRLHLEGRRTG